MLLHAAHARSRTPRHRARRSRLFSTVAAAVVLLLVGTMAVGSVVTAPAAYAADGFLEVTKTVDKSQLAPGDEFTYTIKMSCADEHCIDAMLVDELPAAFENFGIVGTPVVTPASLTTSTAFGCATQVTSNCDFTVKALTALDGAVDGAVGLRAGADLTLTYTLKAPTTLTPAWAHNASPIDNTATVTAANATSKSATARVAVTIPVDVDVAVTKAWAPASQQFQPGVQSTLTLGIRNTSNVNATSLALQDPKVAADAATALPASNPFRLVDFVSFGTVTAPQGADRVQVDAYVLSGGTWSWQNGTPTAIGSIALPAGVAPGDVAGLRLSFTDDGGQPVLAGGGTPGSAAFVVAQRSTDRQTAGSLVLGASASNVVVGTVVVPDQDSLSGDATAPYAIGGLNVVVNAAKTISPLDIPAGGTATGQISGRNDSNGPLNSLTIADNNGFFTQNVKFDGFTAPPTWPAGATAAAIEWWVDGVLDRTDTFANGATPAPPAGVITGFVLRFTGAIAVGATGGATFSIDTTTALVPSTTVSPVALENSVTVTGVNPAGTDDDVKKAPLRAHFPSIGLSLDKTVSPDGGPVNIGGTVVVQLPAVTSGSSSYVRPNQIVITDEAPSPVSASDFWEAFNPIAIAPTQVLAGSTLTIEYKTASVAWTQLVAPVDATGGATVFEYAIPSSLAGQITGLRFVFSNADNFAQATGVTPAIVFEARKTLRTSGDPVATSATTPKTYENLAIATAGGLVDSTPVSSPPANADAAAGVVTRPGDGELYAAKQWRTANGNASRETTTSQSAESSRTRLFWGVPTRGHTSVTLTDPATNAGSPANTAFQAFNLTHINPITRTQDPLLKWDSVTAVELFHSNAWHTVPAPPGSWMDGNGFKGYPLTATEVARTTGVRITVTPNDAARTAEPQDATRPAPGSGIALGVAGANRFFDLQWTLRNTLRVPGATAWATGTTPFNSGTNGTVRNTVSVAAAHPDAPASGTASDDIRLLDFVPSVDITHTASPTSVVIPNPGDIADADYPRVALTLTAESQSVPRASYLRVTTPSCGPLMPACVSDADQWAANPFSGATYDAAANPFERVTLTGLVFTAPSAQVSKDHSMVTLLLRGADGTLSTQQHTITAAEALAASALTDVVGVSVVYQGSDPATNGGSIVNGADLVMVMNTQVRQTLRSGGPGDFVTAGTVSSTGVAQSYDPVLAASGAQSTPNASDPAAFTLRSGALDATAGKQFTPDVVIERNRGDAVQVRLSATDGASTAPTHVVTLTDTDADFWDAITLTSLGAVTLPHGADRVRVDVQAGNGTWVLGTAAATAALPAVDPATVTGIRFVFDRADGGLFSTATLPADWATSAVLNVTVRDTYRGSGAAVGFPAVIENTLRVESARTDDPAIYASARASADDTLALDTGTFGIDVVKNVAGNIHTIDPGEQALWTLNFRNTGTGYLTVDTLVDTLPSHLRFTGEEPVYSTTGSLSTTVELDTTTAGELRFSWPAGGARMDPGEVFSITLTTVLEPGAPTPTTNQFVVTVHQTLGACTNSSGNGQGTLSGLLATQCGTSNFVQPRPGASVVAYKGVKGDVASSVVDGAVNVSNPARECVPDANGYFVSPCAANTVVGGTDEWSLGAMNSGTESIETLTFVEPLPVAGDRLLATGAPRGSTWRPVFDTAFGIDVSRVPAGTSASWQVSTDANLCVGTGAPTWTSDPTCAANSWADAATYAGDWAAVTGIRVVLDFAGTANAALQPGQSATVLFRTVNQPATAVEPSLAPVTVPATDQFAWNQFGVTATFPTSVAMHRAPIKAGVTLPTGQLDVAKQVTGGAAAFAPAEFLVDVSCTIAGVPMNLGAFAQLALQDASGLSATIDGIPLGAQCAVSEVGAVGQYNETSRIGDDATASIMVPTSQLVTITNDYDWGQLSVTKTEDRAFVAIGQQVTYTVTVVNEGARTAYDQIVTDSLPASAKLIRTLPAATQTGTELSWKIDELAPGDSLSYTVVVEYSEVGTHTNRASVTNPPGPWQPVVTEKPCPDDPEQACSNVTVLALTVTGIVWLDWALLFAGILSAFGLLVFWATRRALSRG